MEYQQIKTLLDRYFQGTSTLEEERTLRQYFSGAAVDERLLEYAPLFRLIAGGQKQEMSAQTAEKLFQQFPTAGAKRISLKRTYAQWMFRIAAALVLSIGIWWAYQYQQQSAQTAEVDWSKYEITDEKEALELTRNALFKVSKTLNDGAATAAGKLDRMQEMGKFFK